MEKHEMTRREVVKLLGIGLPVMLVSVEILPGTARGEEPYTRKTLRISDMQRQETLDKWDEYDINYGPHYDAEGRIDGTVVGSVGPEDRLEGEEDIGPGDVIYKINGEPFIFETQEEFDHWMKVVLDIFRNKQTMTVDLDVGGKPYLYVYEFE